MGDLTLSEAVTGGAFARLNWQHSREFDQNFSKKSNAPGFAREGGGWAVLELTGTLRQSRIFLANLTKLSREGDMTKRAEKWPVIG